MSFDEDFNLKVTVRNGRLLRAIRERYSSVADMCRKMGRSHQTVNKLITMKAVPYNSKGWTDLALDIAGMVARDPEDLWPDHMRELRLRKSTSEVNLDLDDVHGSVLVIRKIRIHTSPCAAQRHGAVIILAALHPVERGHL